MTPAACCREDVDALREAGANDEEIHATVQVAAYFNYINRVADALGVDLEPEMQT
jgi:alkylhydroperoxidase family enzyme